MSYSRNSTRINKINAFLAFTLQSLRNYFKCRRADIFQTQTFSRLAISTGQTRAPCNMRKISITVPHAINGEVLKISEHKLASVCLFAGPPPVWKWRSDCTRP